MKLICFIFYVLLVTTWAVQTDSLRENTISVAEDGGNEINGMSVHKMYANTQNLRKTWECFIILSILFLLPGRVAQSVGHLTRKSGVVGSIPGLATYFRFSFRFFKKGSCQLLAKVCARSTG